MLTIDPTLGSEMPLTCHLRVTSLQDAHPYQALSYAWGTQSRNERILIKGNAVSVTKTVKQVLLRIREHWDKDELLCNRIRPGLWIDAIFINQSDDVEKNAQVMMMGQIYSRSQCVLIWLGKPERGPHTNDEDLVSKIHSICSDLDQVSHDSSKKESEDKVFPYQRLSQLMEKP